MISEDLTNDVEAILNDLYPKQMLEGDFITANNTAEGLRARATADEETEITICNKNFVDFDYSSSWQGTALKINGSKITLNKTGTGGISPNKTLLKNLKIKAGTTLTLTTQYVSGDRNDDGEYYWQLGVYFLYSDDVTGSVEKIINSHYCNAELDTIKTTTITLAEDIEGIGFYGYIPGTSSTTNGEVIFDMQLEISDTATDYVEHQEQTYTATELKFKTYAERTHIYNTNNVNMLAEVREKEE